MSAIRGKTVSCICKHCRDPFTARVADRKRGWARFCSKSCKAIQQEKRTGQYANLKNREGSNFDDSDWAHPFSSEGLGQW